MNRTKPALEEFLANQFAVDRRVQPVEIWEHCVPLVFCLMVCVAPYPWAWVKIICGTIVCALLVHLVVDLVRRRSDKAWPVWLDADGIASLDDQRLYYQTQWSKVGLAEVIRSKAGPSECELVLRLFSGSIHGYSIAGPAGVAGREFHARLKDHLGARLSYESAVLQTSPATNKEMILQASELTEAVRSDYVKRFKHTTSARGNFQSIDSSPSMMSEEEHSYLRSQPILDRIDSLIRAAILFEKDISSHTSVLNVAQWHNQLGDHYLFVQEFDNAVVTIQRGMKMLRTLHAQRPDDRDAMGELAYAHFLLCEAHAALYRKSGNTNDRVQARAQHEAAIALGRKCGMDLR